MSDIGGILASHGVAVTQVPVIDYDSVTNEQAFAIMKELLAHQPGLMKVTTAEHRCHGGGRWPSGETDPATAEEIDVCDSFSPNQKSHAHFFCHDVVGIDEPNHDGTVVVHTAEGDWTMGMPRDVLKRMLLPALEGL